MQDTYTCPQCGREFPKAEVPAKFKGGKPLCSACLQAKREAGGRGKGGNPPALPAKDQAVQGGPAAAVPAAVAAGGAVLGALTGAAKPGKESVGGRVADAALDYSIRRFMDWAFAQVPESLVNAVRHAPLGKHAEWVVVLVNFVWEKLDVSFGTSPGWVNIRRNLLNDLAVNLHNRLTGKEATTEEAAEIKQAAEAAEQKVAAERRPRPQPKPTTAVEILNRHPAIRDRVLERIHATYPTPAEEGRALDLLQRYLSSEDELFIIDPLQKDAEGREHTLSPEQFRLRLEHLIINRNEVEAFERAAALIGRGANRALDVSGLRGLGTDLDSALEDLDHWIQNL